MPVPAFVASEPSFQFGNAAGSVSLVPQEAYVRLNWTSQPSSAAIWRQLLEQALVQLEQKSWHKLLGDQRSLPVFSTENQAWILLDWFPRAVRSGLRYGAIVSPQNVMVRLEMAALIRELNTYPLTYQLFSDEAAAISWLAEQV
ncbi:hypothetical protein [Hymenobacter sp. GOD-10R]|uniref:hypothetical protein n=1 Tax=Hymenobacter sp. GOD-10R TaxID=3093922 RepID=UPI002D775226|nr:hypothetical protein [Hymenobacter sp. GOD-10R]WRQ27153.1 hypothetical protein SD425_18945 [Hymenobacter sp. GOD-10R]